MRTLTNALNTAKALAPKIIASPLQAPNIIRRHISAQVVNLLNNLFDTDDDDDDDAGGAPYTTMAPNPYTTMAGRPPMQQAGPAGASVPVGGFIPPRPAPFSAGPAVAGNFGTGQIPARRVPVSAGPAGAPAANPYNRGIVNARPVTPSVDNVPLLKMPDHHLQSDLSKGVKYITDPARRIAKYEVTIIDQVMKRRGGTFDTKMVKAAFMAKGKMPTVAFLGWNMQDGLTRFRDKMEEWAGESLIWVCVQEAGSAQPVFYSNNCRGGNFHHSSFTAGGDVIGAGEWIVDQGWLEKISPTSGHYRPPYEPFRRAVMFMQPAWRPDTVVLLWNIKKDAYDEVPVRQFVATPNGGGIWKTNPNSV